MKRVVIVCLAALVATAANSQSEVHLSHGIGFAEYLNAVDANSLDLQAQQQTVNSARDGVSVAGVRPDPQLSFGVASKELAAANKPSASTALTAGVAFTIETAGKRGARIRSAESNVQLSQAGFEGFRQQLYADATGAFVEACRAQAVLERKRASLQAFRETVAANEVRQKAGDIGLLELRQSRVEAERFGLDVRSATADDEAARVNLAAPLGKPFAEVFGARAVDCGFDRASLPNDLDSLVREALSARSDVRAAQAAVDNARDNLELAHANRWVDPVVNVGLTNTPRVPPVYDSGGNVSNNPADHSLSLGVTVTVPIPFSRAQHGELHQAESALAQAQLQLRSTLLKAETDVRATHAQYRAAAQNVQTYADSVLQESDHVLAGVRIAYRQGASSLLDLLEAQRSADEVYVGYLQAVADLANTRVKLQQASGLRPAL